MSPNSVRLLKGEKVRIVIFFIYLIHVIAHSQNGMDLTQSFSESVWASVLLADISGFTKLSSILDVEDLKAHIK